MIRTRLARLVVLPLVFGVSGCFANREGIDPESRDSSKFPRAVFAERVELDPQVIGEIVEARFQIQNSGTEPLVLSDLRATCGCAGVERLIDGTYFRVAKADIAPGEAAELRLRYSALGEPGKKQRISVKFKSNGREASPGNIEIVHGLRGRIVAVPASIQFGQVRGDRPAHATIEIRDEGLDPPFQLDRSESEKPGMLEAKQLSPSEPGKTIRLQVVFSPALVQGRFVTRLSFFARGAERPALVIPVEGEILPAVQATPSSLVLPRSVGGKQLHEGEIVCRSTRDEQVKIDVENPPEGIAVEVRAGKDDKEKVVRIRSAPLKLGSGNRIVKNTVRLIATSATATHTIELAIHRVPTEE